MAKPSWISHLVLDRARGELMPAVGKSPRRADTCRGKIGVFSPPACAP